jgi:hypothetical protein
MNMPFLTLLHLTLLITFVRWLLNTIHQHLMCWTLQNILVSLLTTMCVSKFYRALLVMFDASFHFSVLSDTEEQ